MTYWSRPKNQQGPWRSITNPTLIANHVCAANKHGYNLDVHVPFGSGYLSETLALNASSTAAKNFLQGTFHPSPDSIMLPETSAILHQLSKPLRLETKDIAAAIAPEQIAYA